MPVLWPNRPPVRRRLLWAVVALLVAGCAQRVEAPTVAPGSVAPAGYACSTGAIFSQPIGVGVHQVVTLGDTTAVLTGTSASDDVEPSAVERGTVTVTAEGRTPITWPLTPPAGASVVDLFTLQTQAQHAATAITDVDTDGSLCLARFSPGATAVALVALTTGGTHCCVSVRAISADGAAPVDHAFGNYAPFLSETTTGPVLVSADDAFAYAFSSFAASGPPLQLFGWDAARFSDVTREHLDLVREDASSLLTSYLDPTASERLGFLAGWVADECLAGETASAWAFVDRQRDAGALVSSRFASPEDFIAKLRTLVASRGYCPN